MSDNLLWEVRQAIDRLTRAVDRLAQSAETFIPQEPLPEAHPTPRRIERPASDVTGEALLEIILSARPRAFGGSMMVREAMATSATYSLWKLTLNVRGIVVVFPHGSSRGDKGWSERQLFLRSYCNGEATAATLEGTSLENLDPREYRRLLMTLPGAVAGVRSVRRKMLSGVVLPTSVLTG